MGNRLSYPDVDLSSKVALVTGGNAGIGYETAKGLARLGAHTFIACRSKERAEKAIESIKYDLLQGANSAAEEKDKVTEEQSANATEAANDGKRDDTKVENIENSKGAENTVVSKPDDGGLCLSSVKHEVKLEYIPLDLASFESTKKCVDSFKKRGLPLHILVNNAGVAGFPFNLTVDGQEFQFQVNHLGPMLLTLELLPVLLETAASSGDVRIVFLSSAGHFNAEKFDPNHLSVTKEEDYKRLQVYFNSKLCTVMTGYCLQRKLKGKKITVSSVHPGFVKTEISRGFKDWKVLGTAFDAVSNVVGKTPKDGAATSLNCAVNPELNSQQHFYYENCKVKESSEESRNELFQEQLWERSFVLLKEYISPDMCVEYGPKSCELGNALPEEYGVTMSEPQTTILDDNQEAAVLLESGHPQEAKKKDNTYAAEVNSLPSKEDNGSQL